jgi:hypothetical protein
VWSRVTPGRVERRKSHRLADDARDGLSLELAGIAGCGSVVAAIEQLVRVFVCEHDEIRRGIERPTTSSIARLSTDPTLRPTTLAGGWRAVSCDHFAASMLLDSLTTANMALESGPDLLIGCLPSHMAP